MDSILVQVCRRLSTRRVLGVAWHGGVLRADDFMERCGFTRSTILQSLDALVEIGLIEETTAPQSGHARTMGRPARWFRLKADGGVLVGLDAGQRTMMATVTDLTGAIQTTQANDIPRPEPAHLQDPADRRQLAGETVAQALHDLGLTTVDVVAIGVGIPAPIDAEGRSPEGWKGFWRTMHSNLLDMFREQFSTVRVENDAALAALAELHFGAARGQRNFVTLLAAWGLGAGVVLDGHLVRGTRGAVGELGFLKHVDGVGGSAGFYDLIEKWIRSRWVAEQLPRSHPWREYLDGRRSRETLLSLLRSDDPIMAPFMGDLVVKVARVVELIARIYDPTTIILAGPAARDAEPILQAVQDGQLTEAGLSFPNVVVSALGEGVVSLGAAAAARELPMTAVIEWALRRL